MFAFTVGPVVFRPESDQRIHTVLMIPDISQVTSGSLYANTENEISTQITKRMDFEELSDTHARLRECRYIAFKKA